MTQHRVENARVHFWTFTPRARQRPGRPGPEIFDLEKDLILNPEPGPDLKFSPETGPKPGNPERVDPARKNPALSRALFTPVSVKVFDTRYFDLLLEFSELQNFCLSDVLQMLEKQNVYISADLLA